MKKLAAMILILCILAGCVLPTPSSDEKGENLTFTATIEQVYDGGILVVAEDIKEFDKAHVRYHESLTLDFTPEAGQRVKITILPEIAESYPVQVVATEVVPLLEKAVYRTITPEEAKKMLESSEDIILLDVRTEGEYKEGHIKGAILLPDTQVEQMAATVLPDLNQTILIYCRSGRRSKAAAQKLIEMGYTQVLDLGGIINWPYEIVK
jgi:rhodanese-related sulfurtransferase